MTAFQSLFADHGDPYMPFPANTPTVDDLPGLDELKGSGLLEGTPPPGFRVPMPSDSETLGDDEDPLDAEDSEWE